MQKRPDQLFRKHKELWPNYRQSWSLTKLFVHTIGRVFNILIPTATFQCKSMGALQQSPPMTLVKRRADWAVLRELAPPSSDSPQSRQI